MHILHLLLEYTKVKRNKTQFPWLNLFMSGLGTNCVMELHADDRYLVVLICSSLII